MQHDEPHATMVGIHASTTHTDTPQAHAPSPATRRSPASLSSMRACCACVSCCRQQIHTRAPTPNQLSQHINISLQPTAALQYGFTKTLYDSTTYNTSPRARADAHYHYNTSPRAWADAHYHYNFDSTLGYPGEGPLKEIIVLGWVCGGVRDESAGKLDKLLRWLSVNTLKV
jgi:hypothetical protein